MRIHTSLVFRVQVVIESFQRDTTIESIRLKYQVPTTVINKLRSILKNRAHKVFEPNPTLEKTRLW